MSWAARRGQRAEGVAPPERWSGDAPVAGFLSKGANAGFVSRDVGSAKAKQRNATKASRVQIWSGDAPVAGMD